MWSSIYAEHSDRRCLYAGRRRSAFHYDQSGGRACVHAQCCRWMVSVLVNRIAGVTQRIRNLREIDENDVARAWLKKEIGELRRRELLLNSALHLAVLAGIGVTFLLSSVSSSPFSDTVANREPPYYSLRHSACWRGRSSGSCRTSGFREASMTTIGREMEKARRPEGVDVVMERRAENAVGLLRRHSLIPSAEYTKSVSFPRVSTRRNSRARTSVHPGVGRCRLPSIRQIHGRSSTLTV